MSFFLLSVSFLFLSIGLVLIYKPAWIIKANKIARERLFNDSLVLLDRQKKGILFLLFFLIFFYWGYQRFQSEPAAVSGKFMPSERLLYQASHQLHLKEYEESKRLCEIVVSREPGNADALYQLGAAKFLLGDPAGAKDSWKKAKTINPASERADRLRKLIVRHKNLHSEDIPALR